MTESRAEELAEKPVVEQISPKPPSKANALIGGALALISYFFAIIGALSLFSELIPTIVRLSIAAKWLASLYALGRNAIWDFARWAFDEIHVPFPQVPESWIDPITICLFVIAGLNFESVSRFRHTLLAGFTKELTRGVSRSFGWKRRQDGRTLFSVYGIPEEVGPTVVGLLVFTSGIPLGAVLAPYAMQEALPFSFQYPDLLGWIFITATTGGITALLVCSFGYFLCWLAGANEDRVPTNIVDWLGRAVVFAGMLPAILLMMMLAALTAGWRSLLFGLGLFAMAIGLNFLAVNMLDPLVLNPPQWLCALANADPEALPVARCDQ